jgi:signal transduction histidine kinase
VRLVLSMVSSSGRVTRRARGSAILVGFTLLARRWHRFTGRKTPAGGDVDRRSPGPPEALAAERRRADDLAAELQRTRAEFDRTIARVNDLFWTVEILPGGETTLTYVSADASGVVGVDVSAGLDAAALRAGLSHPDDAEVNAAFTAAMLAGEAAEVEERLIGVDGVTRWTWSRGTPRHEGDRLFFDGITTNITERHELAERREDLLRREREQVATLEQMQRSRDDFIALAGHELRTPLTVIQGYAEHLLEDPVMGSEQRQQLEVVVRRAMSMSELIDDLFDLSRLDASVSRLAFEAQPLEDLVHEAVREHEPDAAERGVTFRVSTQPVSVLGEPARLRRMFDNLFSNAVKYSPPGAEVSVNLTLDGAEAVVVVADQGIGIPEEELGHVFDRLYRARNAVDGRFPGAGLGLSITLAIAKGLGGTAEAANAPAGGAVLTVRLPAHESADAPRD